MLHLDGPVLSNQLVLHFVTPQSSFCEVFQQVGIHNLWERRKTYSATFPSRDTRLWRHSEYILLHSRSPETLLRAPCVCRCCWCRAQWTRCYPGSGQWKLWAWGPRADCSSHHAWGHTGGAREELNQGWATISTYIIYDISDINSKKDLQEDLLGNLFL